MLAMNSLEPSRVPFDTERYARRSQDGPCFVCAVLAGDRPHHEVYEDADTIAFCRSTRSTPGRARNGLPLPAVGPIVVPSQGTSCLVGWGKRAPDVLLVSPRPTRPGNDGAWLHARSRR